MLSTRNRLTTFFIGSLLASLISLILPVTALAAGISASGGGKHNTGETFTVTVTASGTTFDSLQGTITVSGPVSIVSFSGGSATWLPGKSPANGNQFVGIVSPTSSLTVASIKLKGTKEGSGSVSVGGVRLARSGSEVGTSGGSTSFTIVRAPTPPGAITVTSATHPDQATAYEATTVTLSWDRPGGATGFSYLINDTADTTPDQKVTSNDQTVSYDNQVIGVHYFHIRAINGDGWGATTHFKITIKEPDAKVDNTLAAATISKVEKTDGFKTDLEAGTVTGILVSGTVPAGYQANLIFDPKDKLPGDLKLSTDPSTDGTWQLILDQPIPAGFYKLTAQGQKDKVLTPLSAVVPVEFSVANGGLVKIISADDLPKTAAAGVSVLGMTFHSAGQAWAAVIISLALIAILITVAILMWLRSRKGKGKIASVNKIPGPNPPKKFW